MKKSFNLFLYILTSLISLEYEVSPSLHYSSYCTVALSVLVAFAQVWSFKHVINSVNLFQLISGIKYIIIGVTNENTYTILYFKGLLSLRFDALTQLQSNSKYSPFQIHFFLTLKLTFSTMEDVTIPTLTSL